MDNLGDRRAAERIAQRLVRLQAGLLGDVKPVGAGIIELRVDHGPGYRVYFMPRGRTVVVLLCGGDKRTQTRDIKIAKAMAAEIKESRQ
jgi:putative addiction module killer protein